MKETLAGPAIFIFVLAMITGVFAFAAGIRLSVPAALPHPKSEVDVAAMVQVRPQLKVHEAWCARGHVVGGFCVIR
jgi:hypothetical protein